MQYGNLMNHVVVNQTKSPAPQVGEGATEFMWSDRQVWTVIEVSKNGKIVTLQQDDVKAAEGVDFGHQDWVITPNPNGRTVKVSLRKDGRWKAMGSNHRVFQFGYRHYYYDWSF